MEFSLIWCVQIICFVKISESQYHSDSRDIDLDSEDMDYSHHADYRRTRPRYYHKRPYGSSGGKSPRYYDDYSGSEDCDCQCNQCDNPRPCCQQTCMNCVQQQQPSFLFVPYPVPLIIGKPNETITTTSIRTTCITVTDPLPTTEKPTTQKTTENTVRDTDTEGSDADVRSRGRRRGTSRYMLTSFRKTKSNSLPKYGIVPIPDQLAESLMSQMRSMKGINSRNDRDY